MRVTYTTTMRVRACVSMCVRHHVVGAVQLGEAFLSVLRTTSMSFFCLLAVVSMFVLHLLASELFDFDLQRCLCSVPYVTAVPYSFDARVFIFQGLWLGDRG